MGFGYEALRELHRGIILVNVSAYGQYGPYRDRIGFDPIGQAISGMMSLTGFPGNPPTRTYNRSSTASRPYMARSEPRGPPGTPAVGRGAVYRRVSCRHRL